jgi:hypothetical protein
MKKPKHNFTTQIFDLAVKQIVSDVRPPVIFVVKINGSLVRINGKGSWKAKSTVNGAITRMLQRSYPKCFAKEIAAILNIPLEYGEERLLIKELKQELIDRGIIHIIELNNENTKQTP